MPGGRHDAGTGSQGGNASSLSSGRETGGQGQRSGIGNRWGSPAGRAAPAPPEDGCDVSRAAQAHLQPHADQGSGNRAEVSEVP